MKLSKKALALLGGGVVLAAAVIVVVCVVLFGGEETYRSVRVLEYQGEATVTRDGEEFAVYDDLVVQGGDGLTTGADGEVDLRLDQDKYLVVESSSQVAFQLEGNTEQGAIRIELQAGAVFNSIENPLAEGDSYEIVTPDGVMAVDVSRDSKIRKQASYAIGVLNDFVSWMGKNPADMPESQRVVNYRGQSVTVFRDAPVVVDYPVLPEVAKSQAKQWYKDWLTTFYGMLVDNVTSSDGIKINLEENTLLGNIIKQINGEQASA